MRAASARMQAVAVASPRPASGKRHGGAVPLYPLGLVAIAGLAIALFAYGADYYRLSLAERVHHLEFRDLHPSGKLGYLYGVVGSVLMCFNLLYLVRRRMPRAALGSMRAWLNAHVLSGLGAYVLITFHSAFQQRSALASATFWSLTLVILTGFVGRYLKALSPQPDPARLAGNLRALDRAAPGLGDDIGRLLCMLPVTQVGAAPGPLLCLLTLPAWRRDARQRQRVIAVAVEDALRGKRAARSGRLVEQLARDTTRVATREVRATMATALLRNWRIMHRFVALMMMSTVVVHIVTAWRFGYRWIWTQ